MVLLTLPVVVAVVSLCAASPQSIHTVDFPDPSITFDPQTSHWLTFATHSNEKNVQTATSPTLHGKWSLLTDVDLLPVPGQWVNPTPSYIWAPDVHHIEYTNTHVLYYSGLHANSPHHCIGVVTSPNITGPYSALDEPFACPLADGGAIDAAGFYDESSHSRWVVYKIDGSSKGLGGPCGNGDPPGFDTPIMIQRVSHTDGITPLGNPFPILYRDPKLDGPLIEAPSLIMYGFGREAVYVLFFSSHCYNSPEYGIRYATAKNVLGPYTRQSQLMGAAPVTEERNLTSPGGATSISGGGTMVFHAGCEAGRCMHQADFEVVDGAVKLLLWHPRI